MYDIISAMVVTRDRNGGKQSISIHIYTSSILLLYGMHKRATYFYIGKSNTNRIYYNGRSRSKSWKKWVFTKIVFFSNRASIEQNIVISAVFRKKNTDFFWLLGSFGIWDRVEGMHNQHQHHHQRTMQSTHDYDRMIMLQY